jgi:ABC-type transporter Mla MlaB component
VLPLSYVRDPSPGNWSAPRRRRHWLNYGGFWGLLMAVPHPDLSVDSPECVIGSTSEAVLVRPAGEVTLATVPLLWSNQRAMREDHLNVIVDLKAILGIDSAGMHALLDMHQLFIQCGQRLVLANPRRHKAEQHYSIRHGSWRSTKTANRGACGNHGLWPGAAR